MNKQPTGSAYWAAERGRLAGELDVAQQDIALLLRLKAADGNAKRLGELLTAADEKLAAALADEAAVARGARLGKFQSITVKDEQDGNLVNSTFRATVTSLAFDPNRYENVAQTRTEHLRELAPDALEFLATEQPDAIPSRIMSLAPGEPAEALNRYFIALRRGFVSVRGEL